VLKSEALVSLESGPLIPLTPSMDKFLKDQAPGAKYIMSVCTGAFSLGRAGLLDGKKATTNKAAYKFCVVCLCISHLKARQLLTIRRRTRARTSTGFLKLVG